MFKKKKLEAVGIISVIAVVVTVCILLTRNFRRKKVLRIATQKQSTVFGEIKL